MADGILKGVRIVDMATGIAAPVAAMVLAEVGADVIKVEPRAGDRQRGTPGFAVWNRSKRSVVLDIASEPDRLDQLLGGADAFFHSYTPDEAKALGLDDAALKARHPHLIVCAMTAFPAGLPTSSTPARDTLMFAESGIMDEQKGVRRDGPIYLRLPLGSWCGWNLACAGVLARLIHRNRGGCPGPAHSSLFQGALVPMSMHWYRAEKPTPGLSRGLPKDIIATIFECADGVWLHIMTGVDQTPMVKAEFDKRGAAWVEKADADVGPGYWVPFPHYGAVRDVLKTRPHHEWLDHFRQHDVPVQPVLEMGQILFDEQARINKYVVDVDDPVFGATSQPGVPFTVTPAPQVRHGCRPLGADTEAVFAEAKPPAPAPSRARNDGRAPLAGVKVLDMGGALAGPLCPMLLADLGAEVIKVEPIQGDMMRPIEASFVGCQRGKRSIALQLKDPASREVVERLVGWADIVHHNLRMPAARKLGIDYTSLKQIKSDLIYCHTSSYGPEGPRKDWPGMDQMFQSSCGWELAGAGRDNPPIWHRFGFTDHLCAMASLQAVLLALYHRDRTGEGQFVTASLLGATTLSASETIVLPDGNVSPFEQLDSMQLGLGAFERIYAVRDGWIAVSEPDPVKQTAMCAALAAQTPSACELALASLTQSEALRKLRASKAACAPVRLSQREAFLDSPDNRAVGLYARYQHAMYGTFEQPGVFWNFGDLSIAPTRPPTVLGQHTTEVLMGLGYGGAEIEAFYERKLVATS
jgi:crotonobetainyl-CoA:carnitine CoA-transferase CaiB-like acyl-CoA transferase